MSKWGTNSRALSQRLLEEQTAIRLCSSSDRGRAVPLVFGLWMRTGLKRVGEKGYAYICSSASHILFYLVVIATRLTELLGLFGECGSMLGSCKRERGRKLLFFFTRLPAQALLLISCASAQQCMHVLALSSTKVTHAECQLQVFHLGHMGHAMLWDGVSQTCWASLKWSIYRQFALYILKNVLFIRSSNTALFLATSCIQYFPQTAKKYSGTCKSSLL